MDFINGRLLKITPGKYYQCLFLLMIYSGIIWLVVSKLLAPEFRPATYLDIISSKPCTDEFKEEFNREKRFICTDLIGGFGNYMFAFASAYGIATRVNKTVVISTTNPLIKYFRVRAKTVFDFCVCDTAEFIHEYQNCAFNRKLFNLTGRKNYRPGTFFQSWKYFEHVVNDIRQQYTFPEHVETEALGQIQLKLKDYRMQSSRENGSIGGDITSQVVVTVGVHVRRGDLLLLEKIQFGYVVPPVEYFLRAMTYFRKRYIRPSFIVCSDDILWCKENIVGSDVMYMEKNSFIVDLAILSHCNHSIISIGTFGWWAAFLAAGETIYYKHPATNVYREHFSNDFSDYFYPGWIGME